MRLPCLDIVAPVAKTLLVESVAVLPCVILHLLHIVHAMEGNATSMHYHHVLWACIACSVAK